MSITATLPQGLTIRSPRLDEVQAATDLLRACEMADDGTTTITMQDLLSYWQAPDVNVETDVWVVVNEQGQLIGYADAGHRMHVTLFSDVHVHPDYQNRGIEEVLVRLTEDRLRQHIAEAPANARVTINSWVSHKNTNMPHVLEEAGFQKIRYSWRMRIEMNEAPPAPELPEGVTIRTFVPGQDEHAVFDADDEAFKDHWGYLPMPYEQWEYWSFKREGFDPSLWFLAVEGDRIAGIALCRYDNGDGWVDTLGVLRPWRKKGLGLALLRHAFGEFWRRGTHAVGLGVDALNLTGATRLYTRAGMHVAMQHDTYQKELRPGEELSTQSVAD